MNNADSYEDFYLLNVFYLDDSTDLIAYVDNL